MGLGEGGTAGSLGAIWLGVCRTTQTAGEPLPGKRERAVLTPESCHGTLYSVHDTPLPTDTDRLRDRCTDTDRHTHAQTYRDTCTHTDTQRHTDNTQTGA